MQSQKRREGARGTTKVTTVAMTRTQVTTVAMTRTKVTTMNTATVMAIERKKRMIEEEATAGSTLSPRMSLG